MTFVQNFMLQEKQILDIKNLIWSHFNFLKIYRSSAERFEAGS